MKRWMALVCFCLPCFGYEPWYTGTYLEYSGANTPRGEYNLQTFTTSTLVTGYFQNDWSLNSSVDQTSRTINTVWFNWGMTDWLDFTMVGQLAYVNGSERGEATFFGPIQLYLGFMFAEDQPDTWWPYLRFLYIQEFPTTPYDSLNEGRGFTATSNGSFQSAGVFILEKVFFRNTRHPTDINLNLFYSYQTKAHISGISTFKGDITTNMQTHPGGIYAVNLSLQVSLSQRWIFETDINYSYWGATSLSGELGRLSPALPFPASQAITLTPGFGYSFSKDVGVFASFWVTPWGQNSESLFGIIFSFNGFF